MILIMMGPPGAGKGTQAKIIAKQYNMVHLSTGDMLRTIAMEPTPQGREINQLIKSGKFVSDETTVEIVEKIYNADVNPEKAFILDGIPRTIQQAISLEKIFFDQKVLVIMIEIDFKKVEQRIIGRVVCDMCKTTYHEVSQPLELSGICNICSGRKFTKREDDNTVVVKERLEQYFEKTQPLKEFYQNKNLLRMVDGDQDIQLVSKQISNILENFIRKH